MCYALGPEKQGHGLIARLALTEQALKIFLRAAAAEMYGDLEAVATQPAQALRANSSVIGFGLCMEAIEQNPVVYSLMSEWAFR